jgi:hypothetical protein
MGKLARAAWKAAKPVLKKQASKALNKYGDQASVKTKKVMGKGADMLIDKASDRVGIGHGKLRTSAKKLARKGIDKGVDAGMSYAKKKLR